MTPKKVSFQEPLPSNKNTTQDVTTNCHYDPSELWFCEAELKVSRDQAQLAIFAVNDACGDFDVSNDVRICVSSVLSTQSLKKGDYEALAKASRESSKDSKELARLQAAVLEKEIYESQAITCELIATLVNNLPACVDDDDDDDNVHDVARYHNDRILTTSNNHNNIIQTELKEFMIPIVDPSESGSMTGDGGYNDDESIGTIDDFPDYMNITEESSDCDFHHFMPPKTTTAGDDSQHETVFSWDMTKKHRLDTQINEYAPCTKKRRVSNNFETTANAAPSRTPLCQINLRMDNNQKAIEPFKSAEEELQERCNVANALISLVRWDFRAYNIYERNNLAETMKLKAK